jgi:EAL domain-containing protein (putative c-di-GMP-specific phosphodiesterase class I)
MSMQHGNADEGLDRQTENRRRMVRSATSGLQMVFQPILDLVHGSIVGYEALARFPTDEPEAHFKQAHRVGVGIEVEMEAIVQSMSVRPLTTGYVSINVSPQTVITGTFLRFVAELDDPHRLVLELTEHTPVEDYAQLCAAIAQLREIGVRIAVDDAGSGISSFRHVIMISPDIIKLDRSLIADIDEVAARAALAEAIVQFAQRIGATLVAEGIEREGERVTCLACGIRYGQGFLLGRPVPLDALDVPNEQAIDS